MKRSWLLILFCIILASCFVLSACQPDQEQQEPPEPPVDEEPLDPTKTYKLAVEHIPGNWNSHVSDIFGNGYVLDYTQDTLYEYDYNENKTGFKIVPAMAAHYPTDVSKLYAERFDYSESETGRAYKILLKSNLKFDNGDAITANTFVESMQLLLDPAADNPNACKVYGDGSLKILGAESYANQSEIIIESCVDANGVGTGEFVGWNNVSNEVAAKISFSASQSYVGKWLLNYYKYSEDRVNEVMAHVLLADQTRNAEIAALDGKTLAEINADEQLRATFDELVEGWCTNADEEFGFFVYKYGMGPVDFSSVGFFAEDEHSLVIVLQNAMDLFELNNKLCTNFLLVHPQTYRNCMRVADGSIANNYGTSIQSYVGFGPYKIGNYTSDTLELTKNSCWRGYAEGNALENTIYEADGIKCTVVEDAQARLNMFLRGEIDSYDLTATDAKNGYLFSKYAYSIDSQTTWFVALNPDMEKSAIEAAAAIPATAGNKVIKSPLSIVEFRQALSCCLDRSALILECRPLSSVATGLIGQSYVWNTENGETYRSTEQAKDVILNFWGIADECGEGKEYSTRDQAIASVASGSALAKNLFDRSYQIAREKGFVTDAMHKNGLWELQICVGSVRGGEDSDKLYACLTKNWIEAVSGTPWEGHLTFVKREGLAKNDCAKALSENRIDMLIDVSCSASAFVPQALLNMFVGSAQYDTSTDKSKMFVDVDLDGKILRASVLDWIGKCLQGERIVAKIVDGGVPTGEMLEIYVGDDAYMRLKIMTAAEEAIMQTCNIIPISTDAVVTLRSHRIRLETEEYVWGIGYGGLKYVHFTMSDAEWQKALGEAGGSWNYLDR